MYLRLINVKAIERQRDSYILVINNRYEKMGESLYRINKDALEIIRNLNGTKTFDDLVDMMISCHLEKKEQAKYKLNNFLNELEKNPGISVEYLKKTNPIEIPILGNGKTQYPSAISVEITHRCNAKCLHCYGEYCATNAFKDNTEEIKKLLKDARKAGTRVVEFTGGEVTCHPRFLEILNEAYNLDYSLVSILSNGLFWNKELFALIAEHKEQTVVQIDLHGENDDYINWFMGTQIPNITHRVKDTIMRINNSGILMRVVTMVTPQNIDQIENIAGWVKEAGIETYGISAITPMGRADLEDKNNLLLKTLEQHERVGKVIENINTRYGKGFLYKIKDGNSNAKNCGAFTSNPSITPEGEIKFCAMDNQTVIKSLGNVFKEDIGQLFSNNYQLMNMIRGIQAPDYTSKECSGCEKKYFCSYCIIRGLVAAKEKGFENCAWYSQYIPNEFRRLLI